MTEPIITFKNFSFKYDSQAFPTLQDINLTINRGEKILIAGPSGSGKSTIGRCINGLIPNIDTGTITGECSINGKISRRPTSLTSHLLHRLSCRILTVNSLV